MKLIFVFCFLFFLTSCYNQEKKAKQSNFHLQIAQGLIKECRKTRALNHLFQAVQLNPKDFLAHYTLGALYYSMFEYDKAILKFQKSLKIQPKLKEAHIGLARTYISKGNLNKAFKEIQKAERSGTYPSPLEIIGIKAVAYYEQGSYKKAQMLFNELFSLSKRKNCNLYLDLGKTEMALQNFKKAENLLKKSIQICQKEKHPCQQFNHKSYFLLAELYIKKKEKEKAKYYLKLFLQKRKRGAEVEKAKKMLKQLL